MEQTKKSGITIKEVYGDKAYFKKPILDNIKESEAKAYIPVSEMAYRIDEDRYSYNKDSDEWFEIKQLKKSTRYEGMENKVIDIILKRRNVETVH